MELSIEKFSPTQAELAKLAEESKAIALPDPFDQVQLRRVKDTRLNLRNARVEITKTGKALREDALKFQKAVIAKEKELVAIIEPAETRLAELEDAAQKAVERKTRLELLPHRKERLAAIGDGLFETDDHLLDMDGPEFEAYCNERLAAKNEADRQRIEAENRTIDEEKAKIEREKEMREREEKARAEERERIEREQKESAERQQREQEEAARKEQLEKERIEKEASYQTFLKAHGYTEQTSGQFAIHTDHIAHEVKLYKLVGIHKLK